MIINSAYKYRIYPTKEQEKLLSKCFGCTRYIWNFFLNERKEHYQNNQDKIRDKEVKSLNYFDNSKALTLIKKEKEKQWLQECNAQSLQASLKNLDKAYRMFFKKTHMFPKFKSKYEKQSITIPQHLRIDGNKIKFPKFSDGIKVKIHRDLVGKIKSGTISKDSTGEYYIAIIVEKQIEISVVKTNAIGIDVGIKDFAICSNGERFNNQEILKKYEIKLQKKQKSLSKKKKGSKNRQRARMVVAKIHKKIKNSRIDYIHKISNKITNENQVIVLEDLNIKGMMKNHKLAKSIGDVSWHEFNRQLAYKSKWKGGEIIKIDRFFPSSKICNACGTVNHELTLKDRFWECPMCKTSIDRDLNASKNILQQGMLKYIAVGTTVKSLWSCQR